MPEDETPLTEETAKEADAEQNAEGATEEATEEEKKLSTPRAIDTGFWLYYSEIEQTITSPLEERLLWSMVKNAVKRVSPNSISKKLALK